MKSASQVNDRPQQTPEVFKTSGVCDTPPIAKSSKALIVFYLLCAVAGAAVPWYFNIQAMKQYNTIMILSHYFTDGTAAPLAASITTDFFIGTTPVVVWMCREARWMKMKRWWLLLPATFLVSFAFSCPLFLAIKEYIRLNQATSSHLSSSTQKLFL